MYAHLLPCVARSFQTLLRCYMAVTLQVHSICLITAAVIDALAHANAIDDRKLLVSLCTVLLSLNFMRFQLEHILILLSRLPPGRICATLTNSTAELRKLLFCIQLSLADPSATTESN
jgi:hypothetical protein